MYMLSCQIVDEPFFVIFCQIEFRLDNFKIIFIKNSILSIFELFDYCFKDKTLLYYRLLKIQGRKSKVTKLIEIDKGL